MLTRDDVISRAADECMKELYSLAQPSIEWDDFVKENEIYSKKYKMWERYRFLRDKENKTESELKEFSVYPIWSDKPITECIGPRPYEFYYLPEKIMIEVCDSYVDAYKMDSKQNLLDIIQILKDYCENPIVDKYISEYEDENGNWHPGHRGYEHPDNLKLELIKIISDLEVDEQTLAERFQNKFFEFLDMAGKFFNWNKELNSFNVAVYLGVSPNSNKEAVIKNWKKYRNRNIEIDESKYEEENDDSNG